jgi:hypothetical protein
MSAVQLGPVPPGLVCCSHKALAGLSLCLPFVSALLVPLCSVGRCDSSHLVLVVTLCLTLPILDSLPSLVSNTFLLIATQSLSGEGQVNIQQMCVGGTHE